MATHSSIFAWEIPWTEEPGSLKSQNNLVIKPPLPQDNKYLLTDT